jgi:hypothetical protein
MRQETHDEDPFGVHADLHVREHSGGPAVRELTVGELLVVGETEPPRPRALRPLDRRADFAGRPAELVGVHARVLHHEPQSRIDRLLVRHAM